jgi:hypothetical protein
MKTFEITYALPSGFSGEQDGRKSLNFHRFMRHARECHRNLLSFLIQHGLIAGAGESALIASERKTILSCTDEVFARIRALPFVERAEERREHARRDLARASNSPAG